MKLLPKNNLPWLQDRIVFLTKHGSHAYGTSTPASDLDVRGVAVAPLEYYFGFLDRFEQKEFKEKDLTIFDLQKFMKLAADANPSIIEILFTLPEDHLLVHGIGQRLLDNREMFLSQKVLHTFTGYAISQLRKLQRSKERPPERVNKVRAELIKKYGFDTKDGAHVVRLMRMCEEILTGKGVIVRRPDAEELLAIRNGAWSVEKVIAWGFEMDTKLHNIVSKLPREPDRIAINKLCISMIQSTFDFEIKVPVMQVGFETQTWKYGIGNLTPKKLSITEMKE